MRKFRSTRFSFIFKGRSVDFHRHMKKKSYKIISINYFMVIVYPGIVRKSVSYTHLTLPTILRV